MPSTRTRSGGVKWNQTIGLASQPTATGALVATSVTLAIVMLLGRFMMAIPALAIAGSLASKKAVPTSAGTLPTHGPLFVGLLCGTVIIIAVLTYFPAVSLGPIVEHYLMHSGKLFSFVLLGV